jgi:hypothetical protein
VTGSLTPAGNLSRQSFKKLGGQISLAGSIAKRISKGISGLINFAGSMFSQFIGQFTAASVEAYDFQTMQLAVSAESFLTIADSPVLRMTVGDQRSVELALFDWEVV